MLAVLQENSFRRQDLISQNINREKGVTYFETNGFFMRYIDHDVLPQRVYCSVSESILYTRLNYSDTNKKWRMENDRQKWKC